MKRKFGYCLSAVSVLIVLLLVVSACGGGAATPAPEQPAEEPAAEATEAMEDPAAEATEAMEEPAAEATEAMEEPAAEATEATEEPAAEEAEGEDAFTTIYGERLPEDAAPYDMQVYRVACDITGNQTTFDFQVSVYQRFCGDEGKLNDLFQDQLVTLDKDFNVVPASAESWEVSEDGLTWTFHLKPNLQWSDGTPLTAHDWEATYQLMASPEHAWDFAWFYAGVLQNWD